MPSILRLFFIVLLFTLGWGFGFAGTFVAKDILQVIFKILFLLFGAMLGIYALVIYGFLHSVVRSTWASWLRCQKEQRKWDLNVTELSNEIPVKNGKKKPILEFRDTHYGPEADFRSPVPTDHMEFEEEEEKEDAFTSTVETQEKSIEMDSEDSLSSHSSVGYPVAKSPIDVNFRDYGLGNFKGKDVVDEPVNYDTLSIDQPDSDEETAL